jgi:hypothetical protein
MRHTICAPAKPKSSLTRNAMRRALADSAPSAPSTSTICGGVSPSVPSAYSAGFAFWSPAADCRCTEYTPGPRSRNAASPVSADRRSGTRTAGRPSNATRSQPRTAFVPPSPTRTRTVEPASPVASPTPSGSARAGRRA